MSWYGSHPRFSKKEIKSLLPPAACKLCVYWFRTVAGSSPESWHQAFSHCPRCGIPQWDLLAAINKRLLGVSTPNSQQPRLARHATTTSSAHSPTGNASLDKWIALYQSISLDIRVRAATALVARSDAPLAIMLDILDNLFDAGLGAATEKALLKRVGPDLVAPMISRLHSRNDFIREVACNVLGRCNDTRATGRLLQMIGDPSMMVRRAAGFALAQLRDASALPELTRQYELRRNDDVNVRWALQTALEALGVTPDRRDLL